MSRLWGKLVLALALSAVLAGPVAGASALTVSLNDNVPVRSEQEHIGGIQPVIGAVSASTPFLGSGNLTYHGGPVEKTNKVYAIYWIPTGYTVSANYQSLINGFFTNVAAASGKRSNVYFSDTQYSGITYSATFAGSVVDTNPLPGSGCSDPDTSVCVTDAQITTEIQRVKAAKGWTSNPTTQFFMFTAKGIGSCASFGCSFSSYCAYHGFVGSGSTVTLYANMPYADTVASRCDAGQHPNNDDADATLNVTSHEHNETITDEQLNAWYDAAGYENGDKCAWIFGAFSGTPGHEYNQTINGKHYWLQEEWSNRTSACVQKRT